MLTLPSTHSGINVLQLTFATASTSHEPQQIGIGKPTVNKTLCFYARSLYVMCVTLCKLYLLCRLLKAAGIANVPSLSANKGAKEFIQHQESLWNQLHCLRQLQ
ncbi:TPA: hypothetical protein ACH3X1_006003 [Trebouxia sp. C0004]